MKFPLFLLAVLAAVPAESLLAQGRVQDVIVTTSGGRVRGVEVTELPSLLTISDNTPEAGAGTSSTTLSVSISIRISSASTAAPGCFFHCSIDASETDSDNWGTRISLIAMICVVRKESVNVVRVIW